MFSNSAATACIEVFKAYIIYVYCMCKYNLFVVSISFERPWQAFDSILYRAV